MRNSFHVTAMGDIDDCAQRLVRAFVRTPGPLSPTLRACADRVEPVRTLGGFPRRLAEVPAASATGNVSLRLRKAGPAAALTVADLLDRWSNNYSGEGFGLRGGHWTYGGDHVTTFRLNRVRLVPGVAVSGTGRLEPLRPADEGRPAAAGSRSARTAARQLAHACRWTPRPSSSGRLDGHRVRLSFRAP